MIDNPYKILDIPETATKEEIKKAYRKKAKEYHPDLHPDDPAAAQKMNEVNEAYDMLSNPEKYQRQRQNQNQYTSGYEYYGNRQQSSNQQYYGYGQNRHNYSGNNDSYDYDDFDFYDFFGFGHTQREHFSPHRMPDDSEIFRQAVDLINGRAYSYALQSLSGVSSTLRNARWYYLSAIANYGMGNDALAMNQIETAVQMA